MVVLNGTKYQISIIYVEKEINVTREYQIDN